MNTNSYKKAISFGSNAYSPVNDPLTYCLLDNMDQMFLHGGNSAIYGPNSRPCQLYMAEYCANRWDNFCEVASMNTNTYFPNDVQASDNYGLKSGMTTGQGLIHNTAARKYLTKMNGAFKKFEPFDPTVASSPMISYWVSNCGSQCDSGIPEYAVDPLTIDTDIVMNKILMNPTIATNILINIYNTMKRRGTLSGLKNTKLGNFYNTRAFNSYFVSKGGCR